jgi:hypothetical protein
MSSEEQFNPNAALAVIDAMTAISLADNHNIQTTSAAVDQLTEWQSDTLDHNNDAQSNLINDMDGTDGYNLQIASDNYNQAASEASSASQQFSDWISALQQSISDRGSSLSGMYSLTSQIITSLATFTNLTQSTLA